MDDSFRKWWRRTPDSDRSALFTFAVIFGSLMLFITVIAIFQAVTQI